MLVCITGKADELMGIIQDKGNIESKTYYEQNIYEYLISSDVLDYEMLSPVQYSALTIGIYSLDMIEYIFAMIERILCVKPTNHIIYFHNNLSVLVPYVNDHMIYRDNESLLNFKRLINYSICRYAKIVTADPIASMFYDSKDLIYSNGIVFAPKDKHVDEIYELFSDHSWRYLEMYMNIEQKLKDLSNVAEVKTLGRGTYLAVYYKPYEGVIVDENYIYNDYMLLVGDWMMNSNKDELRRKARKIQAELTDTLAIKVKKTDKWKQLIEFMNSE